MQKQTGSETLPGVLDPTVPIDIGVLSQRERILDAMIDSCAEKTYAATTIADIVGRASISRTTFYKRFADKRECFDAAVAACVEEVKVVAAEAHSSADAPPDAVRKGTAAVLDLFAAKPGLAQLVMGEAVTVESAVVDYYRKLLIPAVERLWQVPGETLRFHSDPGAAFGRAQVMIFDQIAAGRGDRLPEMLPEIAYIAILPFAGHDQALSQARIAGHDTALGSSAPGSDG